MYQMYAVLNIDAQSCKYNQELTIVKQAIGNFQAQQQKLNKLYIANLFRSKRISLIYFNISFSRMPAITAVFTQITLYK